MKVVTFFAAMVCAVGLSQAADALVGESHQVLYLADAGGVVMKLSVVIDGAGP